MPTDDFDLEMQRIFEIDPVRHCKRFRQQRDTGMTNMGGWRVFQDVDTGEMYWAAAITGTAADWRVEVVHHPWCQTGFSPTPFSTGIMQRCECPVQAVKVGEKTLVYPRGIM